MELAAVTTPTLIFDNDRCAFERIAGDFYLHPAFDQLTPPPILSLRLEQLMVQLLEQRREAEAFSSRAGWNNQVPYDWRKTNIERGDWVQPDHAADKKSREIHAEMDRVREERDRAIVLWLEAERSALSDMRARVRAAYNRARELRLRGIVPADREWDWYIAYLVVARRVGLT